MSNEKQAAPLSAEQLDLSLTRDAFISDLTYGVYKAEITALIAQARAAQQATAPVERSAADGIESLTRYAPTDRHRHYADFPEGPMTAAEKGEYVKVADVERLLAARAVGQGVDDARDAAKGGA